MTTQDYNQTGVCVKPRGRAGRPFARVLEGVQRGPWNENLHNPAVWEATKLYGLGACLNPGAIAADAGAGEAGSPRSGEAADGSLDYATYSAGSFSAEYSCPGSADFSRRAHVPGAKPPTSEDLPITCFVSYAENGNLVHVKVPTVNDVNGAPGQTGGGKRGIIHGFTPESRLRCMRELAGIDREKVRKEQLFFATFTYPDEFSLKPAQWKRDMAAWRRRFERRWGLAAIVWKLEFQRRGAPHFHLLIVVPVGMVDQAGEFLKWARLNWYECVGSGDLKHLRHGVDVQPARSWNSVSAYISKYFSKGCQPPIDYSTGEILPVGRWWGIWNKPLLPIRFVTQVVSDGAAKLVARTLKRVKVHRLKDALRKVKASTVQTSVDGGLTPKQRVRSALRNARRSLGRAVNVTEFLLAETSQRLITWASGQQPLPGPAY